MDPSRPSRFQVSPRRFRTIAVAALVVMVLVVITGATVRLTGSGMGCDTWPNCSDERLLQFSDPNEAIEQGNRIFSSIASMGVAALAVVAARRRVPYRRDLFAWSLALLAAVVGQIPLGGITVLAHLHPAAVGSHFVLSMVTVAVATTLLWRSGQAPGPRSPRVGSAPLNLSRAAVVAAGVLMLTGPLVTGSGPHAGDAEARRFGFFIPDVVRIHNINMWVFLTATVVVLFVLARSRAPGDIMRRGQVLLLAIVAQGAIGYTQYAVGIPEWLVLSHIVGATTVLGLTVWFHLGLSAPGAEVPVAEVPADQGAPDGRTVAVHAGTAGPEPSIGAGR